MTSQDYSDYDRLVGQLAFETRGVTISRDVSGAAVLADKMLDLLPGSSGFPREKVFVLLNQLASLNLITSEQGVKLAEHAMTEDGPDGFDEVHRVIHALIGGSLFETCRAFIRRDYLHESGSRWAAFYAASALVRHRHADVLTADDLTILEEAQRLERKQGGTSVEQYETTLEQIQRARSIPASS